MERATNSAITKAMMPTHALSGLAVTLCTAKAIPTPMPRITMKINVAMELPCLISLTYLIHSPEFDDRYSG
jgi:hypothetical protein